MQTKGEKPKLLITRPDQTIHQAISSQHEILIGRLIVAWSRLAQALEEAIWAFLGVGVEDGRIITARLDTKYKMNLFRGLAEKHVVDKESLQDIKFLLKRFADLYEIRSWVAHGNWITVMPDNIVAVTSLRAKTSEDSARNIVVTYEMKPEYMEGLIAQMGIAGDALIDLRHTILAALQDLIAASRGKQQPLPPPK